MISIDSWWDSRTRNRFEALLELVIDAISEDCERLEMILKTINEIYPADPDLKDWDALKAAPVSRHEAVKALEELIADGYAQAFVYDEAETEFLPVDFHKQQASALWFYATPKGIKAARQFPGRRSERHQ